MIMCLACKEKHKYQMLRGNTQRLFVLQFFVSLIVAKTKKIILVGFVNISLQESQLEELLLSLSAFPIVFSSFLILEALRRKTKKEISGLDRLPCFQEETGSISWRKTTYLFQAEKKIENSHDMQ